MEFWVQTDQGFANKPWSTIRDLSSVQAVELRDGEKVVVRVEVEDGDFKYALRRRMVDGVEGDRLYIIRSGSVVVFVERGEVRVRDGFEDTEPYTRI